MIDKIKGIYVLICDCCGEEKDTFDNFYDAVEYKKANGWKSQRFNDVWIDACPECQEG